MRVTSEVATMIRLSKIWPLLLLLLSVCTYNTHSLSLIPPTPLAPPTYFADPTMSTPMTYLPPSYPPFTTPPACTTYDGTVLDIPRGEFREIDCQYCYCDYDGTAYCYYFDCWPAMCVDPVSNGCCSWCPNGNNCLLPSGEILPEGEVRIYENMECQCRNPYDYYNFYNYYYQYHQQAVCDPMPTTPDPCDYATCVPLLCVDAVTPHGGCCPECPNGNNCYLPSGEILPEGEMRVYENMVCQCTNPYNDGYYYDYYYYNGQYGQQAMCYPIPPNPCDYATCMPLPCVDAVVPPGGCCPECLNGNNCYMPSGEIIPVNEIRLFENMLCKCPDDLSFQWGENREAECFPVSTTPPITSTTPAGCRSWDGQFLDLQPGESRINGCEYCYCSYDGIGYCAYADCVVPQCVDPVTSPGGCCAQCPEGPNCQLPSGGILKAGETIDENGMRCSCALNSYSWGLPLAECVPSGCRNWNDELLDMKPGDFVQNGCESCYCDWDGRAYCYSMLCLPPSCLDAVLSSDGCCYECPNGPNCRNWNDELVDMKPGESKQNGCEYCYCDWDGRAYCYYADCMPPPCVDAVLSPDGCCYECPNGPSCLLPSGGTLHAGETIEEEGMTCSCPLDSYNYYYYYWGPVPAMCEPSGCRTMTMDGQLLDLLPGESRANGCEYCSCNPDGVGYCVYSTCSPPTCVDAVVPPGGCCAECLNGNNCLLPSGEILPANEIGWYDNMICQCNSPEYFAQNAICYPFTSPDICSLVTCQPLACQVRVMSPDGCCEVCANGCTLPSGVEIAPGEIRLVDGMLCNCPPETCTPNGKPECFPVTSTPPTTTTSGCRTWDNQFLDLQPGESKTEGCGFCYCDWDGIGYCYYTGACPPPPCVDAEVPPGGCCAECPNGPNCQLPSGEIIPVGESCAHSDLDCTCIFQDGSMVPSLDCRP